MKKTIVCAITVLLLHTGFSQNISTNKTTLDSIAAVTIHYLQAKQADSIYAIAGTDFKNQLTAENFKSVADNQVFPLNDFQKVTYINTTNGINKYKVEERRNCNYLLGLIKTTSCKHF